MNIGSRIHPVFHVTMQEQTGIILTDWCRNKQGTLTNMESGDWGTTPYHLNFDGVNEYVTLEI